MALLFTFLCLLILPSPISFPLLPSLSFFLFPFSFPPFNAFSILGAPFSDGTIQQETKLTGILSTGALRPGLYLLCALCSSYLPKSMETTKSTHSKS